MSAPINYVEPFGNSLAMLLANPAWPGGVLKAPFPAFGGKWRAREIVWPRFGIGMPRVETVNDLNCFIANFWRATRADPEAVAMAADYPVIETDLHARHRWLLAQGPELRARLDADPEAFDAKIAAWWVWGASAWIGTGWCEEGERPSLKLPDCGASRVNGEAHLNHGKGIHGAGMRTPSPRFPDLAGGTQWGTDEPNARAGRGVHSKGARGPAVQLPDVGARAEGGGAGRGVLSGVNRTRLHDIFASLAERLRHVRVACGDWSRICTPAVTYRHGLTAVFLDPEYEGFEYVYGSKKAEGEPLSAKVRAWAIEHGERPDMRIALCGYEGEHDMPASWECVAWKAKGGYANAGDGTNENAKKERVWFSPACLKPGRDVETLGSLFGGPLKSLRGG